MSDISAQVKLTGSYAKFIKFINIIIIIIITAVTAGSSMTSPIASNRATIRRANKPLLEKRRRARINASLNQLKMLVLETLQKDSARYSKLEKADILEMTVVHLRALRHQQKSVLPHRLVTHYGAGYKECANEIRRYFDTVGCPDVALLTRLDSHLSTCIRKVDQVAVDIGFSLSSPKEASASPTTIHHHQQHHHSPIQLSPTNLPFPVQLDPAPLRAEGEDGLDRKGCDEGDACADRSLSSLLSYLGVSSVPCVQQRPVRRRRLPSTAKLDDTVLDENDNVSGREDLEKADSARQLYAAAIDRFGSLRSADTVRDLLLKSFDIQNINNLNMAQHQSYSESSLNNESVWRPW